MTLESGIYKKFKKKFVVDEDGLRRIEGVLKKAEKSYDHALEVVYRVEREDDRFYETYNLTDVLEDPNVGNKQIQIVHVSLRSVKKDDSAEQQDRHSIVRLIFDKENDPPFFKRDVVLIISSENRTWALLLSDDLESQINRLLKSKKTPRWLLYLLLLPVGLAFLQLLKFLYSSDFSYFLGIAIVIMLIATFVVSTFMISKIPGTPQWFLRYFGPESVFLWGDESQEYINREQVRRNIQWGVIVTFLVSFLVNMVSLLYQL